LYYAFQDFLTNSVQSVTSMVNVGPFTKMLLGTPQTPTQELRTEPH